MQLTTEELQVYVGGQIEVQNDAEKYLYRGEIATAEVVGEGDKAVLRVRLTWNAKAEGFPSLPRRWVRDDDLGYEASLLLFERAAARAGHLYFKSPITYESVAFYASDHERNLELSDIEAE